MLLYGRLVTRVVVARDGSPARLIVPDPRWFAQKLWMSQQERTPLKCEGRAPRLQGFDAVHAAMPQFAMDEVLRSRLTTKPHYDRWKEKRPMRRR